MKCIRYFLLLFLVIFIGCSQGEARPSYRIARDPSWYPLALFGKGAILFGFSDELIFEIATEEHLAVQLFVANWDYLQEGLKQNKWDAILSSLPPTLPFTEEFSFSDPYYLLGDLLVVPIQSSITSLAQLNGKEVGVLIGSSSIVTLAQNPSIVIQPFATGAQALASLTSGQIDAVMLPRLLAQSFTQDLYREQLKITSSPLAPPALYLITLKDQSPVLIKAFNQGLASLKKEGIYSNLLTKWQLN